MPHKNDYSCIVICDTGEVKKWTYVHGLYGFSKFLNEKHPGWHYFNVYNRRTREYLARFSPNDFIPQFI
ncbi:hypothetical protein GCM10023313_17110 [Mucilaginibacter defluvii]|uniref:KTSC domain-containing protein n=1 Tax=Mucilaginibacter defluvii TaxID=1196019 RepID=A0ABP9FV53_9SPHI